MSDENQSTVRVLLIDLWDGPGHELYTGALASALAARPELEVGLAINQRMDRRRFCGSIEFLPVRAPTGLGAGQWGRIALQPIELVRSLAAMRRFGPDVIHIVFAYPWYSAAMAFVARIAPVAVTVHDITPHHGEDSARNRLGISSAVRHAGAVFVHGEAARTEALRRHPSLDGRLHSIAFGGYEFPGSDAAGKSENGGNFGGDRGDRGDRGNGIEPEPMTFLFFGRLLPYKGLTTALAALEKLLIVHPDARLIIAGEGDISGDRGALERLGANVEIINRRVTEDELAGLMGRAGAVILPYTHASGSGVVATAAAFARASIATRVGGLVDMIEDGKTGIFVEPGDAEALCSAMSRAIDDPAAMTRMGRAARDHRRAEGSWDGIAEAHARVYQELRAK